MRKNTREAERFYLNPDAVRVGERIGETLRHAADKQAHVDDLLVKQSLKLSSGLSRIALQELQVELMYQQEKLLVRTGEANEIIESELDVKIVDLNDGEPIAEGLLSGVNYNAGTLTIVGEEQREIQYVSDQPKPEDTDQTYFGRKLTVRFEVNSVPKKNERVIRLR